MAANEVSPMDVEVEGFYKMYHTQIDDKCFY